MANPLREIVKVTVFLSKEGWKHKTKQFFLHETPLSFVADGRRIAKDKIMKPDSLIREKHSQYIYFTYCPPESVEKANEMLTLLIKNMVIKAKNEIDDIWVHIQAK